MAKTISMLLSTTRAFEEQSRVSRLTESWSQRIAKLCQEITQRALLEATGLSGKERTINANASLSETGKSDAVKASVRTFVDGLGWLRNEKGSLETRIGNLYGVLFILPPSKLNETVQGLRDSEIRSSISALPATQRDIAYLKYSQDINIEVLRALQQAPIQLISDQIQLRANHDRASRQNAEQYQLFIENSQLLNEVSVILTDCLDLGVAFKLDVKPSVDELGEKVRVNADFAVDHPLASSESTLRVEAVGQD